MLRNTSAPLWKIWTGVCVQRLPVISRLPTPLETRISTMFAKQELEKSHLSLHEVRHLQDLERAKAHQENPDSISSSDMVLMTAQEAGTLWKDNKLKFKSADRLSDADQANDAKSLNRRLDRLLLLLVKSKVSPYTDWFMPRTFLKEGETLRQSVDRLISEDLGLDQFRVLGNAPSAVHKYKYYDEVPQEIKLFLYKAQLLNASSNLNCSKDYHDYAWVTLDELPDYVKSKRLQKVVRSFVTEF